jgi:hypothetical protein
LTAPSRLQLRHRAKARAPFTPRADVPWRLAAAVGALVVVATSSGDAFVAAALLGLAAGAWPGLGAGLAMAATVARWGTSDLAAIAGDQDVLGASVTVGSTWAAASSAMAAAALVLVAGAGRVEGLDRLATAAAAGVGAATLAAGPAPTSAADLALRAGAAVGGVALALLVSTRPVRRLVPPWLPAAVGAVAVAAALV